MADRFTFALDPYAYFCYALGAFQLGGFFPALIVRPFYEAGRFHVALFYVSPALDLPYALGVFPPPWAFDAGRLAMAGAYLAVGYGVRHRRSPLAWKAGQAILGANLLLMPAQRLLRSAPLLGVEPVSYVLLMGVGLYLARAGAGRMRQIAGERAAGTR